MQHVDRLNLQKLGEKIKKLRLSESKSLNKFVFSKGGLTSATWSRLENGLVDTKFSTLVKVASMLNINITELLANIDIDYTIIE